jgi:hypothetical protein
MTDGCDRRDAAARHRSPSIRRSGVMVSALSMFLAIGAQALVLTYTYPVASQSPNYAQDPAASWTVAVDKFNVSYATLEGVSVTMTGYLEGDIWMENTTVGSENTITATLSSVMAVYRGTATGTQLVTRTPTVQETRTFPGFDYVLDWGGTSGATLLDRQASASGNYSTTDAATLALYTGSGTLTHTVTAAMDAFDYSSGGKSASVFPANVTAWSTITVAYTYEYVPEPGALALAGLAASGGLALRRRRTA